MTLGEYLGQSDFRMGRQDVEAAFYDWECRRFLRNQNNDLPLLLPLAREHGGPVLELGCGTGRVTMELAASGVDVVGLDQSRPMLDRLQRKLDARPQTGGRVTLLEADMCAFSLKEQFPLVIAPYNSLCYLSSADLRSCLRTVRGHLKPGHKFFCQVSAIATSAPHRPEWELLAVDYLEPDGSGPVTAMYERTRRDAEQEIVSLDERYVLFWPDGNKEVHEFTVRLRSVHRAEIEPLFALEGFRIIHSYGGLDLCPMTDEDESVLLYIAEAVELK
jgi:SAM-dependent methyltransferase